MKIIIINEKLVAQQSGELVTPSKTAEEDQEFQKFYDEVFIPKFFMGRVTDYITNKVMNCKALKELENFYKQHSNLKIIYRTFEEGTKSIARISLPRFTQMTEDSQIVVVNQTGVLLDKLIEEAKELLKTHDFLGQSVIENESGNFNIDYIVQPDFPKVKTELSFEPILNRGRFRLDIVLNFLIDNNSILTDLKNLRSFEGAWIGKQRSYKSLIGEVGEFLANTQYGSIIEIQPSTQYMSKFAYFSLADPDVPVSKRNYEKGGTKKHNKCLASLGINRVQDNQYEITKPVEAIFDNFFINLKYSTLVLKFGEAKVTIDVVGEKYSRGNPIKVKDIKLPPLKESYKIFNCKRLVKKNSALRNSRTF